MTWDSDDIQLSQGHSHQPFFPNEVMVLLSLHILQKVEKDNTVLLRMSMLIIIQRWKIEKVNKGIHKVHKGTTDTELSSSSWYFYSGLFVASQSKFLHFYCKHPLFRKKNMYVYNEKYWDFL